MEDYYHTLGLSQNASLECIQERYRFLTQAYHPDNFPNNNHKVQAEKHFESISEAFRILSDPISRAKYDETCLVETSYFEYPQEERNEDESAQGSDGSNSGYEEQESYYREASAGQQQNVEDDSTLNSAISTASMIAAGIVFGALVGIVTGVVFQLDPTIAAFIGAIVGAVVGIVIKPIPK
jgi:DnaJ-class molecular chaperone